MRNTFRLFPIMASVLLFSAQSSSAAAIGELSLSIGGVFPQGDYVQYADPGVNFNARGTFHLSAAKAFSGWFDLEFAHFSSEKTDIDVNVGNLVILAGEQTISENAFSMHLGLQLGSGSRRGFFRPRVAAGGGLYIFSTTNSAKIVDDEEDLYSETESQAKFGWRGLAGADLFFSTKWGISIDLFADQVFDLNHSLEYNQNTGALIRTGESARFQGFMIGVVIPFQTIRES